MGRWLKGQRQVNSSHRVPVQRSGLQAEALMRFDPTNMLRANVAKEAVEHLKGRLRGHQVGLIGRTMCPVPPTGDIALAPANIRDGPGADTELSWA